MGDNKQVILVREDLGMSPGKAAAQVAHAAMIFLLEAIRSSYIYSKKHKLVGVLNIREYFSLSEWEWMFSEKDQSPDWKYGGIKKVVLSVRDLADLQVYEAEAKKSGLKAHMVFDEGLNCFTVLAIGPSTEEKIDLITGDTSPNGRLPLYPNKTVNDDTVYTLLWPEDLIKRR